MFEDKDSEPRRGKTSQWARRDPSPSRNRATLQQSQRDPEAERQKKRDEVWQICAGLAGEPRILDRMVIELERALGSLANSARRG